jgi:hypothetical protein
VTKGPDESGLGAAVDERRAVGATSGASANTGDNVTRVSFKEILLFIIFSLMIQSLAMSLLKELCLSMSAMVF